MKVKENDWDEIFLHIAFVIASASHCVSYQVAALLVKDGRIISTGINGTPKGAQNCDDVFPPKTDPAFNRDEHRIFSSNNEIHAEMNAIMFLASEGAGYNLKGTTLYCTNQPCNECLKNLIQTGITRIVYAQPYDFSNYSDLILSAIKSKRIELVHKPINKAAKSFLFVKNAVSQ